MINKMIRWLFFAAGLLVGFAITPMALNSDFVKLNLHVSGSSVEMLIGIIFGTVFFGVIFYLLAPMLIRIVQKGISLIDAGMQKTPTNDILIGAFGLIIGLILANLLVSPFIKLLPNDNQSLSIVAGIVILSVNIIFGIISANFALMRKEDFYSMFTSLKKYGKEKKSRGESRNAMSQPKILDTSVIIDGRIFDILKTGFIEGPIVIPHFVLEELRHIADSSDSLKRARGRRGLDILNQIQKELPIVVEISERDFPELQEVDSKLLKLAQTTIGKVITNDFNLNKVAEFQGVEVLNINELANGVKPVVIPGEEMALQIVKDGKESGQGVAYLDDGTMIVIEGGRKHVGEHVEVIVTSVLQTAAGRMIFAKIKTVQDRAVV